jgi:hypothetical protein
MKKFLTSPLFALIAIAITLFVGFTVDVKAAAASYLALNAVSLSSAGFFDYQLGIDSWTKIADLWVPEVLNEMMQEPVVQSTSFLDSGVVVNSPQLAALASGPGTDATFPFVIEPNDADQQQIEDTAPDIKSLTSSSQKAAFFNRVSTLGATALSGVISGVKPGGDILSVLVNAIKGQRARQRNRLVLAQLSGLYGVTAAPDAATGAFRALRYDAFSETGASPADSLLIDTTKMLYAAALLGERKESLVGGAIIMHSQIEAALTDQEQIDVIRNSQGEIVLRQWKGMTVFISDLLVRDGTTSGKVYYTFMCGRGSIALGEKPQVVTNLAGEVAALQLALTDIAKNNVAVYDRTRFILHPQGAKWNKDNDALTHPESGPSNTEVATAANWALGAADIKNTRIVCIRTNG